jgi:uncharacterized protein YpmB
MKKKILIIVSTITLIIIVLFGFICFGLYSMEIEDHYGDLQTAFFNSNNGDLIVNEETKKFGILKKEWKTIHVIDNNNKETDLYNWVYINGKETKFKIFRLETEIDLITEMEYSEIQEKIRLEKLKQIEIE